MSTGPKRPMKVLVTDADEKHALAAVRALGREKVVVHAGAQTRFALSFLSRHCHRRLVYPDPATAEQEFVEFVTDYCQREQIDVLLPVSYQAHVVVSKHQDRIAKHVHVAVSDYEPMMIAADKGKTMALAESLGIKVPRTFRHLDEVDRYPVVVKGTKGSGAVRYVNSAAELRRLNLDGAIVQEYVPGEGYGFYGLLRHGEPRAIFMHRRRREFPVTGGASTAAESYYDDDLKEQGLRLLRRLMWHGVAMVEMKRDSRDGQYTLMEINPKLWGSLDLSIQAGVNFPYLTALMALHGDVEPVTDYDRATKFCWPFPQDLLHVLARPRSAGQVIADLFDPRTKTNIRLDDLLPNLYLMAMTPLVIASRVVRRRLFFPQGRPEPGP